MIIKSSVRIRNALRLHSKFIASLECRQQFEDNSRDNHTNILMKLFSKLTTILTASVLLINCTPYENGFNQAIDNNIQLESTILGVSVIADSLDVPWEILWGPDNWIWITEQKGIVSRINPKNGEKQELLSIPNVWMKRTSGLLGMAVHPNQKKYPFVFVHYTLEKEGKYFSRLERYTYQKDSLIDPKVIMEIPAGTGHNGSRLMFSKDNKFLFWVTGDIAETGNAQNINSLNGKVLRMNFDGGVPEDNPIKGSLVWASGLRNVQGLIDASNGHLYASEHGDAIEDEVNLILPGGNYGWDIIEGFHDQDYEKSYAKKYNTIEPMISWTPTIAPAGLDFYDAKKIPEWENSLLLTSLKGKSLRILKLNQKGDKIINEEIYLENIYGRIRDLCISPEGDVYISTSNHDWNPMTEPSSTDDRILRIAKVAKAEKTPLIAKDKALEELIYATGDVLYQKYCLACHKSNGKGLTDTFPSLAESAIVGDKSRLISLVLNGSNAAISMPSFKFLTNEELSKVFNYVRSSFGNKGDSIFVKEIEKFR